MAARTIGIIGGSIAALLHHDHDHDHDAEPGRPMETEWGLPSAPLQQWQHPDHTIWFLARHGEAGTIPPHRINYRANIAALKALGCDAVVGLNAVGGITADALPGVLAVPDQLIDYTWGRAHTVYDGQNEKLDFIDFTEPYDANLRQGLVSAATTAGVKVLAAGVYGATQGPRLETRAEIDRLERDGCTLVGMTGMPEAALAREAGLPYASLCQVVNRAAGRSTDSIHAEIEATLNATARHTAAVLDAWFATL